MTSQVILEQPPILDLIDQLEGRHIERRHVVLETELVVRGSTGPASHRP